MGSLFDTLVYEKRRRNPYVFPDKNLIKAEVQYYGDGAFFFGVETWPNGDRWVCRFNDKNGNKIEAWSVEKNLCLWRAIVMLEESHRKILQNKNGKGLIYSNPTICYCGHPMYKNENGDEWCSNIYHPY